MGQGSDGPDFAGAFALEVAPHPDQVRTARLFAAAVARHFGAEEERVEDLKVAISEAATNSIKAHREAGITEPVRVHAESSPGEIRFSVVDSGPGFSAPPPTPMDAKNPATPVAGLFEGSLGLALIQSLFPNLSIDRNEGPGMTVSFTMEVEPPKDGE